MTSIQKDPESSTIATTMDIESSIPSTNNNDASTTPPPPLRKLSSTAEKYDIDGDGKLNDAERAMRNMDKSNRGYITNDKVYEMMQLQLKTQKELFHTKRITCVLLVLVVLLALSNLGTSFAAAHLAKETTVNTESQLITNKKSSPSDSDGEPEILGTQSTDLSIELSRTIENASDGRRILCTRDDGQLDCNVEDSFLSIDWKTCRKMMRHCKRGNTVSVSRTWTSNGDTSRYNICPYEGTIHKYRTSTLTNERGEEFDLELTHGEYCRLEGEALVQSEGEVCDVSNDCAVGLGCRMEGEDEIERCKIVCQRKRWAQRLADECKVDCANTKCLPEIE
eukprot:CAMPEP_0196138286 /NCGR_PEP_ID=MMETSP0910-20130528/5974_1 /TAXON_ID=49265 /ORGANISM="Thalassiosira rotula, Strain GSO102" /LENGTH=336 /DNA_ID=CAMNT_0041398869 /DNA_START=256 /DNA_END=1266 /DNA_ORIENTATION=+